MKRLCLILAYLFLFTQTASAMPLLVGQKVVYRGTVTDLRISAVDGTAFIDNLPYTYQSDFSAGVDGFTAKDGTVAGNVDGIGGQDNVLSLTVNTNNSQHTARKLNVITTGKKYNVTFSYYLPSTNSILVRIVLFRSSGWSTTTSLTTQDSWTTVTVSTTATATGLYWYGANNVSEFTFQDAGGDDVFYIKDVQISEITPYADGNHSIEIYDSSNRMLKGVLKAAGTGETLGDELITSLTNGITHPYETFTTSGTDISSAINSSGLGNALAPNFGASSLGELYKVVVAGITLNSGALPNIRIAYQGEFGTTLFGIPMITGTSYATSILAATSSYPCVASSATSNFSANGISLKKVLTPSSSGATITTLKNGDVYNWSYKNSSFSFNSASYYVIIKLIR